MTDHLWRGRCPDSIVGYDARDPDCPRCAQIGVEPSLAELIRQRCEWWDRMRPSAFAFEVTGDIREILERYEGG